MNFEDLLKRLHQFAGSRIEMAGGEARLEIVRHSEHSFRLVLHNVGADALRVREVVLFDAPHELDADTGLYGEGFSMLAQTGGTLGAPTDIGEYPDRSHYRIPEPDGLRTAYNLLMLRGSRQRLLIGFASCHRFCGRFGFDATRLRVSLDLENLELPAGACWELEEFFVAVGQNRDELLAQFADMISQNHPPSLTPSPPTGWCSWYCFGPDVTAGQVRANLEAIQRDEPQLRYVQIDDGFQRAMGDWLEPGSSFGGHVQSILSEIRARGCQPALWLAPFIAQSDSSLLRAHPEWFVQDENGAPLASDRIGFGGWRNAPWFALDGTHPQVQEWLENLTRVLRREWGVTYFKLDANYWGALHGGRRYDPRATRIEAYRRGMEALRRGAPDAFFLGCNHPMWPSLGLIHGSRASGDIARHWPTVKNTARENLLRGWQNGRLWWNDPDCVLLSDDATDVVDAGGQRAEYGALHENEKLFHATAIFASGGMLLSGDDLSLPDARRHELLQKLMPPNEAAFRFDEENLQNGCGERGGEAFLAFFNGSDEVQTRQLATPATDFWTGEALAAPQTITLPPHSARLLRLENSTT